MSDDTNIDQSALGAGAGSVGDGLKAVTEGVQAAQALGQAHALQGLDIQDPDSVDQTIGALAQRGGVEQASALSNLNFTRSMRGQAPALIGALLHNAEGGSSDAPAASPSPGAGAAPPPVLPGAGGGAPTPGNFQFNPAKATAIMSDAAKAASMLSQETDPAARRAAFYGSGNDTGIKGYFLAHGVPEASIDELAAHLDDPQTLQQLGAHYTEMAQHFGNLKQLPSGGAASPGAPGMGAGGAPGAPAVQNTGPGQAAVAVTAPSGAVQVPPDAPPPPAAAAAPVAASVAAGVQKNGVLWGQKFLNNPANAAIIGQLKAAGYDMTSLLEAAKANAGPEIEQQAVEAHAAPIEAARQGVQAQYKFTTVTLPSGATTQVRDDQLSQYLATHNNAQITGPGLQDAARLQTAGAEGVRQAYTPVVVHTKTGDLTMSGSQFGAATGQGGSFQGLSPQEQAAQTATGTNAAELAKPDPKVVQRAAQIQQQGQSILQKVDQLGQLDNTTGGKLAIGKVLRSAGLGGPDVDNFVNGAAGLDQLTTNLTAAAARQDFGARITNADLQAEQHGGIHLGSPNEQAKSYVATKVALSNRDADFEHFKANLPPTVDRSDPSSIMRAWLGTPGQPGPGGRSLYADPIWQNVQIAGKPAVVPFSVKGAPYLRIGLGTGHPYDVPLYSAGNP